MHTAATVRLLLSGGPTKKRELMSAFINKLMNSLFGPPVSTAPSPWPQASTNTTLRFILGLNFRLLKALKALPRTSALMTLILFAGGAGEITSSCACSVRRVSKEAPPQMSSRMTLIRSASGAGVGGAGGGDDTVSSGVFWNGRWISLVNGWTRDSSQCATT